ncbi:hypothetical protein ACFLUU_05500 [Chloroflexota bacterium]
MRILGILNIVAGSSILGLIIWLLAERILRVNFPDLNSIIFIGFFLLVAGTPLASGVFVIKRSNVIVFIWATVSFAFAEFVLIWLLVMILFVLSG